jgi:hypothetical protein
MGYKLPGREFAFGVVMEINLQILFNIGVGAIFAIGGWFFRQLWDATKELRKDLHAIEKDLPVVYVRREEFTEIMREIRAMFEKIHDKLDGKADKA